MIKEISNKIIVHTDGGSRGNPGPSAIGVIIEGIGNERKEYSEYIGEATNNVAEYKAVILALKKTRQLAGREALESTPVAIYMDSELICRQLRGEYKVEVKDLQILFMEVWNLKFDFPHLSFHEVPREDNTLADRMVNACLDKQASKLF